MVFMVKIWQKKYLGARKDHGASKCIGFAFNFTVGIGLPGVTKDIVDIYLCVYIGQADA